MKRKLKQLSGSGIILCRQESVRTFSIHCKQLLVPVLICGKIPDFVNNFELCYFRIKKR